MAMVRTEVMRRLQMSMRFPRRKHLGTKVFAG
jgi:hypothetical protein